MAPANPVCATCQTAASKYTCPSCGTRTCSLSCTRTHKTQCTPNTGPSTSFPFIPLSTYTPTHLYSDYLFLSDLSRISAQLGLEASKLQRPDTRSKESLRKQLYFRRLGIMLLPEGMERRKQNQTAWNGREKKMRYTVGVKFGGEEKRVNRIEGSKQISALVQEELCRKKVHIKEYSLLVQLADQRLKNEGTNRFLEWWNRKPESERNNTSLQEQLASSSFLPDHVLLSLQAIRKPEQRNTTPYVRVPDNCTVEGLLQSLPTHYAVVEFPTFEVWETEKVGELRLLELRGKREAEEQRPPAKRRQLQVAQTSLVAYASSSDQEEISNENLLDDAAPEDQRQETGLLPSYDISSEPEEASSTLADLARKAGFKVLPPSKFSILNHAQDDDEVDFDG